MREQLCSMLIGFPSYVDNSNSVPISPQIVGYAKDFLSNGDFRENSASEEYEVCHFNGKRSSLE